jgi:hypothetical protein
MRIKVSKQSENVFNQTDDKKPPKLAVQVKSTGEKGKYQIIIIHPNRNADLKYDPLYNEIHEAKNFEEALDIAREIERTRFFDIETKYEEIKFIPSYKKGFVKLKTKEAAEDAKVEQAAAEKKEKKEAKDAQKQIKKIMSSGKKVAGSTKINNKINKKQKKTKK